MANYYVIRVKFHWGLPRLAPSRLFERLSQTNEQRSRTNERRSPEETTCLACMDSNLICILLVVVVGKINSSWTNFRSRYYLNRSKLRPCWRKDEFRRISLSLLHFSTVLHYFNPYTYIVVKYQRESRGFSARKGKTTKANFRQKKSSWTKSSI